MKSSLLLIAIFFLMFQIPPGVQGAENDVRRADHAWATAIAAKSLDETTSFYASDAVTAGSAMFSAKGIAEFRKEWSKLFSDPNFSLSWKTEHVVVTKSGTIAYTSGTWSSDGDTGPYLAVWQKQNDGKWKVLIDAAWQRR